jgi:hypothetical protein
MRHSLLQQFCPLCVLVCGCIGMCGYIRTYVWISLHVYVPLCVCYIYKCAVVEANGSLAVNLISICDKVPLCLSCCTWGSAFCLMGWLSQGLQALCYSLPTLYVVWHSIELRLYWVNPWLSIILNTLSLHDPLPLSSFSPLLHSSSSSTQGFT